MAANLTSWKHGQSGNPAGRPRGLSLLKLLYSELQKPAGDGSALKRKDLFVARCVDLAIAGHPFFARLVWEYVEGKPESHADVDLNVTLKLETARQLLGMNDGRVA